jgi:ribosomal protein S2
MVFPAAVGSHIGEGTVRRGVRNKYLKFLVPTNDRSSKSAAVDATRFARAAECRRQRAFNVQLQESKQRRRIPRRRRSFGSPQQHQSQRRV